MQATSKGYGFPITKILTGSKLGLTVISCIYLYELWPLLCNLYLEWLLSLVKRFCKIKRTLLDLIAGRYQFYCWNIQGHLLKYMYAYINIYKIYSNKKMSKLYSTLTNRLSEISINWTIIWLKCLEFFSVTGCPFCITCGCPVLTHLTNVWFFFCYCFLIKS